MKTSILVTAVTGTGKSTVYKALRELGQNAYDIETIDGLYELIDEKTSQVIPGGLDQIREGVDWTCNKSRLNEILNAETAQLTFYCGGMANTEDVWNTFDSVIILTVSDETTIQRLSTRQPGEFGSTQENRTWVLSSYSLYRCFCYNLSYARQNSSV
jgi:broad-specificity NMP kinase